MKSHVIAGPANATRQPASATAERTGVVAAEGETCKALRSAPKVAINQSPRQLAQRRAIEAALDPQQSRQRDQILQLKATLGSSPGQLQASLTKTVQLENGKDDDERSDYDDYDDDHIESLAEDYLARRERHQTSLPKPKSRPPGNGKIYDRYKNRHSSHKTQWTADTLAHGRFDPDKDPQEGSGSGQQPDGRSVAETGPSPHPDDYSRRPRGYQDTGRRDRIDAGAEFVAPEPGERTGLIGVPQGVGRSILGNILSGSPPMRPELGNNGKVTWATETHRDGVELPSRPYSGRESASNAILKPSYNMGEDDRHIPEQAVDRVYRHYESRLTRKKSKKNRGDLNPVDRRQISGEAGRLAWQHLGVHGEGGPGITTMSVPGKHPLSEQSGVFATMPEHAKHRMTLEGQEKYQLPHSRRPRHPVQDGSAMSDFLGTLTPVDAPAEQIAPPTGRRRPPRAAATVKQGSYETVNNLSEGPPPTLASRKEERRRKLAEKKELKQRGKKKARAQSKGGPKG